MKWTVPFAYHAARLLLGAIFLYAGAVKGADVRAFASQVAAYRLLPEVGNVLVAVTLPYIEVIAGILLLAGARVRAAALLLGLLTVAFMAVLGSAFARGLDLDCGCFGLGGRTSALAALVRDAGFLLLAGIIFLLRGRNQGAAS